MTSNKVVNFAIDTCRAVTTLTHRRCRRAAFRHDELTYLALIASLLIIVPVILLRRWRVADQRIVT